MIKKTVCLNMIVKNEHAVIQRCLESVKGIIDYWVIVDTGSCDGTQRIIKETLKDIPGELHERPWVNFEHNRNEALALTKNHEDYLLFIDADDQLVFRHSDRWPELVDDCYTLAQHHGGCISPYTLLVNHRFDWKWVGIVHERIVCPEATKRSWLKDIFLLVSYEGNRSKDLKQKFLSDAQMLEQLLENDPLNIRNIFHVAACYESAEQWSLSLKYYEKRAAIGDVNSETFISLYRMGVLQEKLKMPPEEFLQSYVKAYQMQPTRAEPLFCLANYYMSIECYTLGYYISKFALANTKLDDFFYALIYIYEYGLLDQLAECAFRLGQYQEAYEALRQILSVQNLPADVRAVCEKNIFLPVFDEFRKPHSS